MTPLASSTEFDTFSADNIYYLLALYPVLIGR